ncbi:MAG: serine hydrolase [Bacteroidetes bacterium 4572_112]|nr:MAG: serine hydrolase [Bacteroidetes bacterium 4572_112]
MHINKFITVMVVLSIMFMMSCGEPEKVIVEKIPEKVSESTLSKRAKRAVSRKLNAYFLDQSKHHGFNGSVLIAKRNEIVFKGDYGIADFSNKTKLDTSYSYQLASVSKQFTAAAIVLLQQQGKLQFDDSVTKYFPDFHYNRVTIRQCLTHTAGLPKYFWIAEHKWEEDYPPTNMQLMEMMEDDDVLPFFTAGRKFAYSNTAYLVLAAIVEEVSGMSYAQYLQENIFEPIGMTHSYAYSYYYDKVREKQLWGYRRSGRRFIKIPGTVNDAVVGDKNVYSTTYDLFKWYKVLNNGELITDSNRILMYTLGKTSRGYEIPYGFGFHIEKENNHKVVFHNGKWNGFRNSFRQYPDNDLLIIVLEHSSYRGFNSFIKSVKGIANSYNYDKL